jgi:hypothetical protein
MSEFNLSEKIQEHYSIEYDAIETEDVKEFIKKLKDFPIAPYGKSPIQMDNETLKKLLVESFIEKIDKLAGEKLK